MLIALCAEKGSPGVTTSAVALAAAWPTPAFVVEADPAGGDLAIRARVGGAALPEAPTILSVAAAARSNREPDLLARHAQRLNDDVALVPGAILSEQMAGVTDWLALARALVRSGSPVFADLGRLGSSLKVLELAAYADLVVTVARPDPVSVIRLRERLPRLATDLAALRGAPPILFPLLVTSRRHGEADVSDLRGLLDETAAKPFIRGAAWLALDPAAVRRLEAGHEPAGRLARTELLQTARTAAQQLARSLGKACPSDALPEASRSRR